MNLQRDIFEHRPVSDHLCEEDNEYLTTQLITYLGNKRSLLNFIGQGISIVQKKINRNRLSTFDVFSGSGIVARYLKQFSSKVITNDIESYSHVINECYLTNKVDFDYKLFDDIYSDIKNKLHTKSLLSGFIRELYAPADETNIKENDRVFYTVRNAMYIDTLRQYIEIIPDKMKKFFIAPLLSEASIHSNTAGVFKGFYKNTLSNSGQYGGNNKDALVRILGNIELKKTIFSNFTCDFKNYKEDANTLISNLDEVDLAYIDPPYNQHPYGSNYFMLNLIVDYKKPDNISQVSGIPSDWNKSKYNKKQCAYDEFNDLVENIKAKFMLISFNSEGFIKLEDMIRLLKNHGRLEILETKYNTFRGCRNLYKREKHVKEYLYLLEKA